MAEIPQGISASSPDMAGVSPVRRATVPAYAAFVLTAIWLGLAAYFLFHDRADPVTITQAFLGEIALMMAPVAVFWLIALVFQRTDPLLERRLAMAQTMNRALAPVEAAEARLAALNKKLRDEVDTIERVVVLASDRIDNLEDRFQSQVSDLFGATAEAEARAVAIKDSLAREREEISVMGDALSERLENFESAVNRLHGRILGAGDKTAATAVSVETRLDSGIKKLGETTNSLKDQLEDIIATVGQSAKSFEHSVDDTEVRLNSVADTLLKGMSSFKKDVEGLEGRSHDFAEQMQAQGRLLAELSAEAAEKSVTIQEVLARHVGDVKEAASDALDQTEQVAARVAEQAKIMSDDLRAELTEAGEAAITTSDGLSATIADLLKNSRDLLSEVATERQSLIDQANSDLDVLRVTMMNATATARETLGGLKESFDQQGADIVAEADATASRTLDQLRQLRAGIEAELEDLSSAANQTIGRIDAASSDLAENARSIVENADQATGRLADTSKAMAGHSDNARMELATVLQRLHTVEETLKEKQNRLSDAATTASSHLSEAMTLYDTKVRNLGEQAILSSEQIDTAHNTLLDREMSLRDLSNAMQGDLQSVSTSLLQTTHTMRAELSKSRTEITASAEDLASRQAALGETAQSLTDELSIASDSMSSEAAKFRHEAESATHDLLQAAEAVRIESERADTIMRDAVSSSHAELTERLSGLSSEAEQRLTVMKEDLQATLTRLMEEYEANAKRAEKESAHLTMRLGSEAVRIAEVTDKFIVKAKDLENQLKETGGQSFARTSKLLMQALNEASVDIHRSLNSQIDDGDWEAYLSGDRSRFIRKTVQIGDRKVRAKIAKKFDSDRDFKATVARFMRDFESLMERSMDGDRGDALSVTIISSDMGKLYVMLAQALKKLN